MHTTVQFGWRVPAFPLDGTRGRDFGDQIFAYLDALQGHFTSAWVADHFVPWHGSFDPATDTLESWTTL